MQEKAHVKLLQLDHALLGVALYYFVC